MYRVEDLLKERVLKKDDIIGTFADEIRRKKYTGKVKCSVGLIFPEFCRDGPNEYILHNPVKTAQVAYHR